MKGDSMNPYGCRLIGEYDKGDKIGEGTYGIVFIAKDRQNS